MDEEVEEFKELLLKLQASRFIHNLRGLFKKLDFGYKNNEIIRGVRYNKNVIIFYYDFLKYSEFKKISDENNISYNLATKHLNEVIDYYLAENKISFNINFRINWGSGNSYKNYFTNSIKRVKEVKGLYLPDLIFVENMCHYYYNSDLFLPRKCGKTTLLIYDKLINAILNPKDYKLTVENKHDCKEFDRISKQSQIFSKLFNEMYIINYSGGKYINLRLKSVYTRITSSYLYCEIWNYMSINNLL